MNFTKFSRKIVAAALAVCMLGSVAVTGVGSYIGLSTTVNAAETTASDFEYQINGDGTLDITRYRGSAENLVIPSVIDGVTVKSIGEQAFQDCTNLKSVTIPDSVQEISRYAFSGCTGLTSVKMSKNLIKTGFCAFKGCTELTSITIPDTIKKIDSYTFENCTKLKNITFPAKSIEIGYDVFEDTAWYKSQPNGIVYIGKVAYGYKGELPENTHIVIKNGTEAIADQAFAEMDYSESGLSGGSKIKSVTIPNTVKQIGSYAFEGCTGLTSVTIPDGVTSIGDSAFCFCYNLESITIPDSITKMGGDVFLYTEWYYNQPNGVIYIGNIVYGYRGTMPENTHITLKNGTKVIAGYSFSAKELTGITIPNSVKSIGDGAFDSCHSLTDVTIPDSVKSIGNSAFGSCQSLTDVTIPDSVTSLGESVFKNCSELTIVKTGDGLTLIGESAFEGCTKLKNVTIGKSVTEISYRAFYDCKGLTDITIPDNVKIIGIDAFYNCSELKSLKIGNGVKSIGSYAFCACESLTDVTIPDSVTSIGTYAFDRCSGLTSIKTGNGLKSINKNAFRSCTKLKDLIIGKSVSKISFYAFADCPSLTVVIIPATVTEMNSFAFFSCPNLIIYGSKGSAAETYALENGKPFVIMPFNKSTISSTAITLGNTVTLKGYVTGGKSPYQYTFLCKHSTATKWTTLTSYGTTSTRVWQPTKTGTYQAAVKIKDANGVAVSKFFTLTVYDKSVLLNNSTLSKTTINYGDALTITGKATGATSPYQYSFLCKHSTETKWTTLTSYGTTSKRVWQPKKTGTYTVRAKVKDSTGKEVLKDFTLTVKSSPLSNSSTLSKTTINYGDSLTITGKATGGTTPYQYSFLCKHSTETKWTTLTSYGTTSTRVWQPKKTGTYTVRAKVKDSTGKEVLKDFTLTVKAPLSNSSTLSKTSINYGDAITITGKATGGTTPYQYSFLCKHSTETKWTTLTSYGTTSKRVWQPKKTGTYTVRTKVKDATGKEVIKDFQLTVKSTLANNSTISKTSINYGDAITITGKATGGKSPYQYTFLCKHSTETKWTTLTSYGTTSKRVWQPKKTGTYTVRTKVKDATGKEVIKDFTLTVK
ncbi:MAG: leucine-rich repeat protein [Acutalibacteraceae bacterium]